MKILNRNEVDINTTWNLKDLYNTLEDFNKDLESVVTEIDSFNKNYEGTITTAQNAVDALNINAKLIEKITRLSTYVSLYNSEDQSNNDAMELSGRLGLSLGESFAKLNFLNQELALLDETILNEIKDLDPSLNAVIDNLIRNIPHNLDPKVEDAITDLGASLGSPYEIYNMAKLVDMKFDPINVNNKDIELSFGYYEDELAFSNDIETRHKAFDSFHKSLKDNSNTFASIYKSQVLKEKTMARLKNFDSTIDYLLFNQEVSRDMYDRQIDTIMDELAPHMRRFAKHLQDIHKLDKMTYKDLSLVVDPEYEPDISIDAAKVHLLEGLSVLGDDYLNMINRSFDERWIDFPQNKGKSTGAFCSSPYGVHPYVLISWTHKMREVFVLAHELGHAGHFLLAGENQSIYNTRASLYIIEAPSTMNELLMANHLKTTSDDPRFKRWILSTLVSRTYYHNFVTHLLEAAFQREVYKRIDDNLPISASILNDIYQNVLEKFWGDDVEISEGSNLTWMRQPHYYMGLYPYTYSAGLTVATESSRKLLEGSLDIEQWKNLLKSGGSKTPLELAQLVDIDLGSTEPLKNTIKHIADMIDEIIALTEELDGK
ncbi:MAG: oligoendopeptidase F [Erysipelothrix sp.]|nr:oligoendopeptidase F [Erysipelothrix sp.]